MYTIPGKRKRKPRLSLNNGCLPRGIGRPMKPSSELKPLRDAQTRQLVLATQQLRSEQQEMKSSAPLESLPVELIQYIFFLCLETNLPKASRRLASALSSDSTYRPLILFAYFEDDGVFPVETSYFLPARYRMLDALEKVKLQRGILGCQWFTYDRYFSYVPVLSKLRMMQEWHAERSDKKDYADSHGQIALTVAHGALPFAGLPDSDDQQQMEQHFDARQGPAANDAHLLLDRVGTSYLPRITTWSMVPITAQDPTSRQVASYGTSIVGARILPDWLVQGGPWNAKNLQLLHHLRQGNDFIDRSPSMSISAPAVLAGIENSIVERHIQALTTLLELHSAFFRSQADTAFSAPTLVHPSNHPIPPATFHLAARQGAQAAQLIALLIRAGIDSIKHDDYVMTRWALRDRDDGGGVGRWLLRHLSGTNNYQLDSNGRLFEQGALTRPNEDVIDLSAENTFAEELNYLSSDLHIRR